MPFIIAGGALVGGYLASEGAKDAAGESAKGSRYAADLEQKRYEQSREDMQPWMRSGRESLAQMNRMMGLPYYDYSQPIAPTAADPAEADARFNKAIAGIPRQFMPSGLRSQLRSQFDAREAKAAEGAAPDYQLMRPGDEGYDGGDFKKTPGYQFRLDEGLKALQRSASAGSMSSGSLKGMMEYGQNYASAEYQNQYNRLASMAGQGQVSTQGIGQLGAASAARQGGYIQAGANARASGYLGQSQAIGGTLGSLASIYGSSGSGGGGGGGGGYGGGYVAPGGSFAPSNMYQAPDYGGNQ